MKLDFDLKNINVRRELFVRRYLVIGLSMLVIGLLMIGLVIIPQLTHIYDLEATKTKEALALTKLQQKVKSLQEIDYLQAYNSNDKVNLALPSEKPLLQLLSSSNYVAQQTGVVISDIDTTPGLVATAGAQLAVQDAGTSQLVTPGADTLETLTIQLRVKGTLAQIYNFLDKIEQVTPMTQVTRLQLSSALSNNATDVFESNLELTTYYFTQPIFVTVDAPLPDIGTQEQNFLNALDGFTFPDYQQQQGIQGGGSQDLFKEDTAPPP